MSESNFEGLPEDDRNSSSSRDSFIVSDPLLRASPERNISSGSYESASTFTNPVPEEDEALKEPDPRQAVLDSINQLREAKNFPEISFPQLRMVADKLDAHRKDFEAPCGICGEREVEDGEGTVFCAGCNIQVHPSCYGFLHPPLGDWLCMRCALRGTSETRCVLCPNLTGAMKCSADGSVWAHISCALWHPDVCFWDHELRYPIEFCPEGVSKERMKLRCSLCKGEKKKEGVCIQCTYKRCAIPFHVTCGYQNKLTFVIEADASRPDGVKKTSYCWKHTKKSSSGASTPPQHDEVLAKVSHELQIEQDIVEDIYECWKNSPVFTPLQQKHQSFLDRRNGFKKMNILSCDLVARERSRKSILMKKLNIWHKTLELIRDSIAREEEPEPVWEPEDLVMDIMDSKNPVTSAAVSIEDALIHLKDPEPIVEQEMRRNLLKRSSTSAFEAHPVKKPKSNFSLQIDFEMSSFACLFCAEPHELAELPDKIAEHLNYKRYSCGQCAFSSHTLDGVVEHRDTENHPINMSSGDDEPYVKDIARIIKGDFEYAERHGIDFKYAAMLEECKRKRGCQFAKTPALGKCPLCTDLVKRGEGQEHVSTHIGYKPHICRGCEFVTSDCGELLQHRNETGHFVLFNGNKNAYYNRIVALIYDDMLYLANCEEAGQPIEDLWLDVERPLDVAEDKNGGFTKDGHSMEM
ncbi:hypothetical protein L596_017287 [Steinernema carpocapsae]|uniref:PHD-type domain-containing protein n=1 Tax=Steinernema carpocapsae TaxID=34508 RepID=A0A4U5N1Y8_STECR|nr:hypothetical protein L596_017287 [Steinernema carpocapsae]